MAPLTFVVVCEAAADFRTATGLIERVVCEQVDWIDDKLIEHCLTWQGRDHESPFWLWGNIGGRARAAGVKIRGLFDEEPGGVDAKTTRRALTYIQDQLDGQPLDAILLIHDDDGDPDHRRGLEQGRAAVPDLSDRIVIGLAHLKRECWVLAGFVAADQGEVDRLATLRQTLGFDPCRDSHRLRAKLDHEKRSAKRVLGQLTQDRWERQAACWLETPLAMLRERGEASGLRAFLGEVTDRLVPLFGMGPGSRTG